MPQKHAKHGSRHRHHRGYKSQAAAPTPYVWLRKIKNLTRRIGRDSVSFVASARKNLTASGSRHLMKRIGRRLMAGKPVFSVNLVAHMLVAVFLLFLTSFLFASAYLSWEEKVKEYYKPTPLVLDFIVWAKRAATVASPVPKLLSKLVESENKLLSGLSGTLRKIFNPTPAPVKVADKTPSSPAPAPAAPLAEVKPAAVPTSSPALPKAATTTKAKPAPKPVEAETPIPSGFVTPPAPAPEPAPPAIEPPETSIVSSPASPSAVSSANFVFAPDAAGVTFEYNLDGAGWIASGKILSLSNLSNGSHTIQVRARDSEGRTDASPAQFSWQVAVPPPPPGGGQAITLSVDTAPEPFISTTSASFAFSSNYGSSATFECNLDGAGWSACPPSVTYSNLAEGSHRLIVTAVYQSIDRSSEATLNWFVDIALPTVVLNDLSAWTDFGAYGSSGLTVSYAGADGGATSSGILNYDVEYAIDGGAWQGWNEAVEDTSAVFGMPMSIGQTAGFRARSRDNAGNASDWSATEETKFAELRPSHLVISEVQIGGTTSTDEFVELYNPSGDAVTMSDYRLAVKDSSGNETDLLDNFQNIQIDVSSYLLIAHADYAGAALRDLGYSGTSSIAADNTVLLYNNGQLVDKLGFGAASDFYGAAYPVNPADGESLERKAVATSTAVTLAPGGAHNDQGNSFNSRDNSFDFVLRAAADPQNVDSGSEILARGNSPFRLALAKTRSILDDAYRFLSGNWFDLTSIRFMAYVVSRAAADLGDRIVAGRYLTVDNLISRLIRLT